MSAEPVLQRVYREHRVRMLAALIRVLGDFELAEDALRTGALSRSARGAKRRRTTRWHGC